jgi:hypothetical protein
MIENFNNDPTKPVQVKLVAQIAGQVVSMSRGVGPLVFIHSRHLYHAIESRISWMAHIPLSSDAVKELQFWLQNVERLNGVELFSQLVQFDNLVFSDASNTAYGGYTVNNGQYLLCQGNWSPVECGKSSTWRELKAVDNILLSLCVKFKHHKVQWFTDNQNVVRVIARGSMRHDLHTLAHSICQTCTLNHIQISPVWIPRESNVRADYLSKCSDNDDWSMQPCIYSWLEGMWGPFSVDRFATPYNSQCQMFYSRYWTPGCEGVDAFSVDWHDENNWVVPPSNRIIQVVKHFRLCQARGALIIPLCKGASFWTAICPDGVHFADFVTDWVGIPEFFFPCTVKGRAHSNIFTGYFLPFKMLGLKIDCAIHSRRLSFRGFCTLESGICVKCVDSLASTSMTSVLTALKCFL